MKIQDDDYVVAKVRVKPELFLVLNANSGRAVLEEGSDTDEPTYANLTKESILANLGSDPNIDIGKSVYGVNVEPFQRMVKSQKFGNLYIHRNFDKTEQKRLSSALNEIYDLFEDKASTSFLPVNKMKVLPRRGKFAGSYKRKEGKEGPLDEISFFCTFENQVENRYIIAHEWSHGLWFRCVDRAIQSKWIKLYQKRLRVSEFDEAELNDLMNSVMDYETPNDYYKEVADDIQKAILKEVFKYWKSYHNLSKESIELLFKEDREKFMELWPKHSLLKEENPDVTKYAMKNVEEFFAESFSHWILGFELPKDVKKACIYTAKRCRS